MNAALKTKENLMGNKKTPLVSIGMAVYNEARYIQQALNSLLSQNYENFELIISDNASEDNTQEICLDYATKNNQIHYHRFKKNKGGLANGKRVMELAKGKYFMLAGGHDLWAPDVIARCIDTLESDSEVVLAYPRAIRIDYQGNSLGLAANQIDTRSMPPLERFKHLIWKISGGDLIYGVIRTQALKQIESKAIWGADQAILAELSLKGTFAHIPETFFYWRKVRDESMEVRKKTVPLMLDPVNGYRMLKMELPELWRELGDECLAVIDRASLPYRDKMILKSETKRCFTERYNVRWPASIPKSDSRDRVKTGSLKPKQIQELNFWLNIRKNGWRGFAPREWRVAHIHFKQYSLMYINRSISDLENKVVIEIGCGPAGIIPYLNNAIGIGVDPLIDEYKKMWDLSSDKVKYVCSEIETFKTYIQANVVICWNVLDRVSDIEIATKKLFDILKPDGELWFMINLDDSSGYSKVVKESPDSAHPYRVNAVSISGLFKKYGFFWKEKVLMEDQLNNRHPILMGALGKSIGNKEGQKKTLLKIKQFCSNLSRSIAP